MSDRKGPWVLKRYPSPVEAAEILGCTKSQVRKGIERGEIPVVAITTGDRVAFGVDMEVVWDAIQNHIPQVNSEIAKILELENEGP